LAAEEVSHLASEMLVPAEMHLKPELK
jgi:hypothetical protein